MKYIFIPLIKLVVLLYTVFIAIPILFISFVIVWAWTFDLELAMDLKLLPWQEQRIEFWCIRQPIHWHKLPYNTDIVYPTMFHQVLGLNPIYIKLPDSYEALHRSTPNTQSVSDPNNVAEDHY